MATAENIEAVWRIEQPKLAARLARYLRDVGLAEEIVQDAFVQAMERRRSGRRCARISGTPG